METEAPTPEVNENNVLRVGAARFADLCAVHAQTVSNWIRDGLPISRRAGRAYVDLAVGFPWVRAKDREALDAARSRTDPDGARAAKTAAEARLKELDLAEREGSIVQAAEVEARWSEVITAIRESVMSVPAVAVQGGLVEPAREADLASVCRDALVAAVRARAPEGEDE